MELGRSFDEILFNCGRGSFVFSLNVYTSIILKPYILFLKLTKCQQTIWQTGAIWEKIKSLYHSSSLLCYYSSYRMGEVESK